VTIVVGIVAHTSRAETARVLRRAVGASVCVFDDGSLRCEGNHIAVLNELSYRHADWCVVLEDDAQPVNNFRVHVKEALLHAPAPVVGLYLGTGNPSGAAQRTIGVAVRAAIERDWAWIVGDCLIGSVGYALRIRHAADLLADINGREGELPLRISRWAQSRDVPVCYTRPSLVDHADGEPVDCAMLAPGGRRGERRAWDYGTRKRWDTPAMVLGVVPGWSRPDA
jgi:hypothetical protein